MSHYLQAAMSPTTVALSSPEKPLLFEGLTWREFKAVEQLLNRPGYRLSFLDGLLEICPMPGEPHDRCITMVNHVEAIRVFQQSLVP
jgi:Uma2 family endonuclease